MQITVTIPDEFVGRVVSEGRTATDAALESMGLEAYRTGRLSEHELQVFLGLGSRFEVEQLLKDHGVTEGAYGVRDWHEDEATAAKLSQKSSSDAA